jgi:predicted ribosomally synthesized peptide with nif11-like leader
MSQEAVVTFLKRLDEDAQLKKKFFETVPPQISSGAPIVAFAGQHGFTFTEDDLKKAASTMPAEGQLSDEQLGAVAGGAGFGLGTVGYRVLRASSQLAVGGKAFV